MKRILGLVTLVILVAACGSRYERNLMDIEKWLDDHRDSAYVCLQSPEWNNLQSDRLKAKHALLLTIAEDKVDAVSSSDSIIRLAYTYYSQSAATRKEHMLAAYYYGDYYEDHQEYGDALWMFKEAIELAKAENDPFYSGMAARELGICYRALCNPQDAMSFLRQAVYYFHRANKFQHEEHANLLLSEILAQEKEYEEAEKGLLRAIAYYTGHEDMLHLQEAYSFLMAMNVQNRGMAASAVESYEDRQTRLGMEPNYYDCGVLALAYAKLQKPEISHRYIESSIQKAGTSSNYLYWAHYWAFYAYKELKDIEHAFQEYEQMEAASSHTILQILSQSVGESHRSFHYRQWKELEERTHTLRVGIWFLITLLAVASLVIMLQCIRNRKSRQDNQSLQTNLAQTEAALKELEEKNLRLLATKNVCIPPGEFLLDHVASLIYANQQEKIQASVIADIKDLQDGTTFRSMENAINRAMDGVLNRLRDETTSLRREDIILYTYVIARLSNTAICVLTGAKNPNAVSSKISRLRAKIEKDAPRHKDLFLGLMDER